MITVAQFKTHARIEDDPLDSAIQDDLDADIQLKIDAAKTQAELATGQTFEQRNRVMSFDAWADCFPLVGPPVQSIVSVEYLDESMDVVPVAGSSYTLFQRHKSAYVIFAGSFDRPALGALRGAIEITYTAGYAANEMPAPVRAWVLMRAAAMYETRESDNDRPAAPVDFVDSLLDPFKVWHA